MVALWSARCRIQDEDSDRGYELGVLMSDPEVSLQQASMSVCIVFGWNLGGRHVR